MDHDTRLIQESLSVAERRAGQLIRFFYTHLFWRRPELRNLFPREFDEQHDRLFAALTYAAAHIDEPATQEYLEQLGRDHRKFNVRYEHYADVSASLLAALRNICGHRWSTAMEQAWRGACDAITDAMKKGAHTSREGGEPRWWDARVLQVRRHTPRLAVLTLQPLLPYPHRAGQFACVQLPRCPRTWRPYSLAPASHSGGVLDLHVSKVAGGTLSTALVERTERGDLLRLGPAMGTMTLPSKVSACPVFIGAGTGWAPLKSLVHELASRQASLSARVALVVRRPVDLYDAPYLHSLARSHPALHLTIIDNNHRTELPTALRDLAAIPTTADWAHSDFFVSGPPGFTHYVRAALMMSGIEAWRIRSDPLPAPSPHTTPTPGSHGDRFLLPRDPVWINPLHRPPGD
ncbi:globin domain-containing protein [Streptomyces sp. NPDC058989]|uniref:globin domain-containing protein n=1 Tax=Streptomyces sp. NPDC058989 TaxID=3346686 RepID=UPI003684006B